MSKCLVVIHNLTKSGSPQTFLHVIEALKSKNFDVDVYVYAVRNRNVDLYFYNSYKDKCSKIYISNIKINSLSYKLFPLLKFFKIKRIIKKNKYDLIISNSMYFMADCSAHKKQLNNPKLIYYALGNVNIQSKFAIIRKKERFIRKYLKELDAYIAISNIAIPKEDIAPTPIYRLLDYPNIFFPDLVKSTSGDEIVLGQIGYYCSNKNQLFSLSLLKELIDNGWRARLLFIGFQLSEEPHYYEELVDYVRKHNLDSFVKFLSSDYDKKTFFNSIDILLLPSLFEGSPISLLEAQFSNTYCIVSDSVPNDVDFGLCSFSKLETKEWIKRIIAAKKKRNGVKPNRTYTKREFNESFLSIIADVLR